MWLSPEISLSSCMARSFEMSAEAIVPALAWPEEQLREVDGATRPAHANARRRAARAQDVLAVAGAPDPALEPDPRPGRCRARDGDEQRGQRDERTHGLLPIMPAMNFDFSDDQKVLRDQARKFLSQHAAPAKVRRILEGAEPYDKE